MATRRERRLPPGELRRGRRCASRPRPQSQIMNGHATHSVALLGRPLNANGPVPRTPWPRWVQDDETACCRACAADPTLRGRGAGDRTGVTAQTALRRPNKTLARSKEGSSRRRRAKDRPTRIHVRGAFLRAEIAHQLSFRCATRLSRLTIEDLNVAGMTQLCTLAKAVADAGTGDLGRLLRYTARW